MPSGTYIWSQTAASNATADSAIGWAEGQAPSSVNDSARSMMAVLKKHDDDISGAIVTGGTSTAYTVASYSTFDSLAHMSGQMIAFTPHTTNGATVTLNVDGLGAKPLRSAPGVELLAGTLIEGTPYTCLYDNSDAVWYLRGFYGNPYNVPLGAGMDYWLPTAPNSSFAFPFGQEISRTTYATLFAAMGTTYGGGDGSTTFKLPDKRGRVSAGKDDMGGSSANRLTNADDGLNGDTLGATGGGETQTLATANLPAYTPSGSVAITSINQITRDFTGVGSPDINTLSTGTSGITRTNGLPFSGGTATFTGTAQGGTSTAFGIVQPTIVCNYIMRII
ncbi:microcystin-dependent protein [Bradyrhizobium sp. AZCC 1588]|uniref:phage tail protein n=1 Tax=unclassified Bradyrhizobium TaxID=2631580 RepID=UPI002FF2CAE0